MHQHSLCYCTVSVGLSVHPSVTFAYVYCVKTCKVSSNFSTIHTVLVFLYQTLWQYSDENSLNTEAYNERV